MFYHGPTLTWHSHVPKKILLYISFPISWFSGLSLKKIFILNKSSLVVLYLEKQTNIFYILTMDNFR